MSSAATRASDGEETEEWRDWDAAWRRARVTALIKRALRDYLNAHPDGATNEETMSVAETIVGSLASEHPRCIHEKHPGVGYRPEWEHRTASARESIARYDRATKHWFPTH